MTESALTKIQGKTFSATYWEQEVCEWWLVDSGLADALRAIDERDGIIYATIRFEDSCGNGHNTFTITADILIRNRRDSCGMLHDEIAKYFPHLQPYLKWHNCSTDGPMHYIANARYWAGHCGWRVGQPNSPPNLEYLYNTIVFGAVPDWDKDARPMEMNDNDLQQWLRNRLPKLLEAFRNDVEELGFTW